MLTYFNQGCDVVKKAKIKVEQDLSYSTFVSNLLDWKVEKDLVAMVKKISIDKLLEWKNRNNDSIFHIIAFSLHRPKEEYESVDNVSMFNQVLTNLLNLSKTSGSSQDDKKAPYEKIRSTLITQVKDSFEVIKQKLDSYLNDVDSRTIQKKRRKIEELFRCKNKDNVSILRVFLSLKDAEYFPVIENFIEQFSGFIDYENLDKEGRTALFYLVSYCPEKYQQKCIVLIDKIVAKHPEIIRKKDINDDNVLHYSIGRGYESIKISEHLINKYRNENLTSVIDKNGDSPLHIMAKCFPFHLFRIMNLRMDKDSCELKKKYREHIERWEGIDKQFADSYSYINNSVDYYIDKKFYEVSIFRNPGFHQSIQSLLVLVFGKTLGDKISNCRKIEEGSTVKEPNKIEKLQQKLDLISEFNKSILPTILSNQRIMMKLEDLSYREKLANIMLGSSDKNKYFEFIVSIIEEIFKAHLAENELKEFLEKIKNINDQISKESKRLAEEIEEKNNAMRQGVDRVNQIIPKSLRSNKISYSPALLEQKPHEKFDALEKIRDEINNLIGDFNVLVKKDGKEYLCINRSVIAGRIYKKFYSDSLKLMEQMSSKIKKDEKDQIFADIRVLKKRVSEYARQENQLKERREVLKILYYSLGDSLVLKTPVSAVIKRNNSLYNVQEILLKYHDIFLKRFGEKFKTFMPEITERSAHLVNIFLEHEDSKAYRLEIMKNLFSSYITGNPFTTLVPISKEFLSDGDYQMFLIKRLNLGQYYSSNKYSSVFGQNLINSPLLVSIKNRLEPYQTLQSKQTDCELNLMNFKEEIKFLKLCRITVITLVSATMVGFCVMSFIAKGSVWGLQYGLDRNIFFVCISSLNITILSIIIYVIVDEKVQKKNDGIYAEQNKLKEVMEKIEFIEKRADDTIDVTTQAQKPAPGTALIKGSSVSYIDDNDKAGPITAFRK